MVSPGARMVRKLGRMRLGLLGACLTLATLLSALLAPVLSPAAPTVVSLTNRLRPPLTRDASGNMHLLGTDQLGRDVLSRVLYGARISLLIALVTVALSGFLGFALGLTAGYSGGALDTLVMRLVDLNMAFPFILLALTIVALLGPSVVHIILVFVVTSWPVYARTTRASVLVVRGQEYVEAARSVGAPPSRVLLLHILPNIVGPMLVVASFEMARVVIVEAAMGFLGLGIRPPTPTWGNMLADGRGYIRDAWWLSTFPGLAIVLLAAAVNFIGDAARDALDPRFR
jgi:peptide/nickel transport system permease protein